ncbi:MAG: hypothetical protein IPP63_19040 [Chloracidobacterium sp.]|nr:hypothetical protein [Chloracidobacterium sp.]
MKYISGGDLAARLRSTSGGRIDERTVTEWAIQVADVLSYLHNLRHHRLPRPEAIEYLLDGTSGKVMLIDFRIARSINQQEKALPPSVPWAMHRLSYSPGRSSPVGHLQSRIDDVPSADGS